MVYLILITFTVFLIFWLGDLIITLKTVAIGGKHIEANPILRFVFGFRKKFIYVLKPLEIGVFLYLIWFLTKFKGASSFYILLVFILVYSLLVVNNAHVYYKVTGKESIIFKLVYVGTVFTMLAFIYLNFLLFQDLSTSYKAIGEANSRYNEFYQKSSLQNKSVGAPLPQDLDAVLESLNLSIRRGIG